MRTLPVPRHDPYYRRSMVAIAPGGGPAGKGAPGTAAGPPPATGAGSRWSGDVQGAGRRIARAAAVLLGGFVVSRLAGLLRDIVIYTRFGTSAELDVYYAAFRIP